MKRFKWMAAVLLGAIVLTACGKPAEESKGESKEESRENSSLQQESKEDSAEESNVQGLPEGMVYSVYTGLPVTEETALTQPVAVVLNNISAARPQSGIEGADIIYETEAEGGITRLVGIFQNYKDIEKIGSVRSARRYFLDFALDQGAVLLHYGQDNNIKDVYDQIGCRHMDGLSRLDGTMTWRSSDRKAPHNVYTNGERIQEALEICEIDKNLKETERRTFVFAKEWRVPQGGQEALQVGLPVYDSQFIYNRDKKVYERYQDEAAYIDLETGDKVSFTNVLFQKTPIAVGSDGEHMDIQTTGSGTGYYLTGGRVYEVTWTRNSGEYTRWYGEDGQELLLNPGTTWVNVIRAEASVTIE